MLRGTASDLPTPGEFAVVDAPVVQLPVAVIV
jgi:hypothetical protein